MAGVIPKWNIRFPKCAVGGSLPKCHASVTETCFESKPFIPLKPHCKLLSLCFFHPPYLYSEACRPKVRWKTTARPSLDILPASLRHVRCLRPMLKYLRAIIRISLLVVLLIPQPRSLLHSTSFSGFEGSILWCINLTPTLANTCPDHSICCAVKMTS